MYPETDSEPIVVTGRMLEAIARSTVHVNERIERIKGGISHAQLAEQMVYSPRLPLYEYVTSRIKGINLVVATTVLEKLRELERSGVDTSLDRDVFLGIFSMYAEGRITKAAIGEILRHSPKSVSEIDGIISADSLQRMSGSRLKEIIKKAGNKERGEIIREIMSKYRLNVDGDELNKMLGG